METRLLKGILKGILKGKKKKFIKNDSISHGDKIAKRYFLVSWKISEEVSKINIKVL